MRPDEKERIIVSLRAGGAVCLMCGDGANDVGALKQAQVCIYTVLHIYIPISMFFNIHTDRILCECMCSNTLTWAV
jgi:hypothetical protein